MVFQQGIKKEVEDAAPAVEKWTRRVSVHPTDGIKASGRHRARGWSTSRGCHLPQETGAKDWFSVSLIFNPTPPITGISFSFLSPHLMTFVTHCRKWTVTCKTPQGLSPLTREANLAKICLVISMILTLGSPRSTPRGKDSSLRGVIEISCSKHGNGSLEQVSDSTEVLLNIMFNIHVLYREKNSVVWDTMKYMFSELVTPTERSFLLHAHPESQVKKKQRVSWLQVPQT